MVSQASLFAVPAQNAVSRKVLRQCLIIYKENWDQLVMSAAGTAQEDVCVREARVRNLRSRKVRWLV